MYSLSINSYLVSTNSVLVMYHVLYTDIIKPSDLSRERMRDLIKKKLDGLGTFGRTVEFCA
jgi:hypothetical protein